MNQFHKKLFILQQEIGAISKDSKNPYFKSKYFDINSLIKSLLPLLKKHRILLLQPIINNEVCTILEDLESDEPKIMSSIPLGDITDPQKLGGAITYYRRYTLQSLLGLQAEDDDGNTASGRQVESQPKFNQSFI